MPEGFEVQPHWVSGYGNLMDREQGELNTISQYIYLWTNPDFGHVGDHFQGLMSAMKTPVKMYANSAQDRFGSSTRVTSHTATELRRVAWEYLGLEKENTSTFHGELKVERDEDAEYYPTSELDDEKDLPTREVNPEPYVEYYGKFSFNTLFTDEFFQHVVGWSPLNDILVPLAGNWDVLVRAGESLISAGDAAEKVAETMKSGLTTLDLHWDGGAAQDCASYVTRLYEAVDEEGPLNRTVGKVLKFIAEEVIEAINSIGVDLHSPSRGMMHILYPTGWLCVPVVTDETIKQALDLYNNFKYLYDAARGMVDAIADAIDMANELIEVMADPAGAAESLDVTIPGTETKLSQYLNDAEAKLVTGKDLADLANPSELADLPDDGFEVGDDAERDGD